MGLALVPPNFFGIEPGPDLPASVGSEGLGGLSTFRVWPALNVRACIAATLRNSLPVGLLGGAAPTPRSAAPATLVLPRRPTHRLAASGPGAAIASKLRRAPTLPNCGATGHRLGALFWGSHGLGEAHQTTTRNAHSPAIVSQNTVACAKPASLSVIVIGTASFATANR
jgi:hypothetical protein